MFLAHSGCRGKKPAGVPPEFSSKAIQTVSGRNAASPCWAALEIVLLTNPQYKHKKEAATAYVPQNPEQ
jgi:hypothetical protein